MHNSTLWAALIAVLLIPLLHTLITALSSPLRKVPGPFLTRFTRLWYFRSVWGGNAQHDQIHLHRAYGSRENGSPAFAPVVRLGPNLYSISRPEKAVYGIAARAPKSAWYDGWKHPHPDRWTLFPDRDVGRHAATRRKFQNMYSLSSLLNYEPFVDAALEVFRARLREMAGREAGPGGSEGRRVGGVNLHHWLQCFAFDVVSNISFGRRFGFLDAGEDIEGCMANLKAAMAYSALVGIYPWAHPVLYWILEKLPGSGAAGRTYLMRFVRSLVAERKEERAKMGKGPASVEKEGAPRDFLDLIMDAQEDPAKGVTPYHVFMMGLSNVIAGSDTTAFSLSGIMYHLIRNPRCLEKLRTELDGAVQEGKMTSEYISFKESQKLPYLQACIKEGLRLCSATGLPLWRIVPEGGLQMLGNYFPAGTEVGLNAWVLHFDPDIWGEDVNTFRPERWIEADAEQLKFLDSHYVPFGLGSRTCLGRHISDLEISKVLPTIVSLFDFDLDNPDDEWHTSNFWLIRPTNFFVSVRSRRRTSK